LGNAIRKSEEISKQHFLKNSIVWICFAKYPRLPNTKFKKGKFMMTYTTTNGMAEQLEFSEADMETLEYGSAEAGIESQLQENLESVSFESVAEDVEAYMEGDLERRPPSSLVIKRLTKIFTALVKNTVKKITSNPRTRAKLQAACRKGPDAVAQLLAPIITKTLPTYFTWMSAIFVPPIVVRLFPAISKDAGLKSDEVSVGTEGLIRDLWGLLW
jgi:hypothetical protein